MRKGQMLVHTAALHLCRDANTMGASCSVRLLTVTGCLAQCDAPCEDYTRSMQGSAGLTYDDDVDASSLHHSEGFVDGVSEGSACSVRSFSGKSIRDKHARLTILASID